MTVKLKSVLPQAHLKGEQFIVNIFCYILKIITILFGSFLLLICNVFRPEPDVFYDSDLNPNKSSEDEDLDTEDMKDELITDDEKDKGRAL